MHNNPDDETNNQTPVNSEETITYKQPAQVDNLQPVYPRDRPKRGFRITKRTSLIAGAVLILLAISAVVISYYVNRQQDQQLATSAIQTGDGSSVRFHNYTIPNVNCSQLEGFARHKKIFKDNIDKYLCYKESLNLEEERVDYVRIQFSAAEEKKQSKACDDVIDCGQVVDYTVDESINLGEYLIRGDGSVEAYRFTLPSPSFVLNDILGCGTGEAVDYQKDGGVLVIDNNRIGLLSDYKNLKVEDRFGNICNVDLKFVSYITANSDIQMVNDQVRVDSIKISYRLKEIDSCKAQAYLSSKKKCYSAQAMLRSDASVCENLASPTPNPSTNPGFDDCIIDVAKQKRDPVVCEEIRYYKKQMLESCIEDVTKFKKVFSGEIDNI